MSAFVYTLNAIITLLVMAGVWTVLRKRRLARTRTLTRVAEELAMCSRPQRDAELRETLESLPDFRWRFQGELSNVLWKDLGSADLAMFEFEPDGRYASSRGRIFRKLCSGFYLYSPDFDPPSFLLRSRGIIQKVRGLFAWDDLDFTRHPEFSKRYSLHGEDSDRLGTLFDDDVVSFFENRVRPPEKIGIPGIYYLREHPLPSVEAQGNGFLYLPNRLIAPDDLPSLVPDILKLFELLGGSIETTGICSTVSTRTR